MKKSEVSVPIHFLIVELLIQFQLPLMNELLPPLSHTHFGETSHDCPAISPAYLLPEPSPPQYGHQLGQEKERVRAIDKKKLTYRDPFAVRVAWETPAISHLKAIPH
jgi:hypothetical protein